MVVPMTGKLATLDRFVKGSKTLSKSLFTKKGNQAVEVVSEATDDPDEEMKTFWFSSEQENQQDGSWMPGLVR